MELGKLFAIGLLAIFAITLAGCGAKPQANVSVWVSDEKGNPVSGVYIKGYTEYAFGTGAGNKWTSLNGTIEGTGRTNENGFAELELVPGNFAFQAWKEGYDYAGQEKTLKAGSNSVYITIKSSAIEPPVPGTGTIDLSIYDETGAAWDMKTKPIYAYMRFCSNEGKCEAAWSQYNSPGSENARTGTYNIAFVAKGYRIETTEITLKPNESKKVRIEMEKELIDNKVIVAESQNIGPLAGDGTLDGKIATAKLVQIASTGVSQYTATFDLVVAEISGDTSVESKKDTKTVKVGDDLRVAFGNLISVPAVVKDISVDPKTGTGSATVLVNPSATSTNKVPVTITFTQGADGAMLLDVAKVKVLVDYTFCPAPSGSTKPPCSSDKGVQATQNPIKGEMEAGSTWNGTFYSTTLTPASVSLTPTATSGAIYKEVNMKTRTAVSVSTAKAGKVIPI